MLVLTLLGLCVASQTTRAVDEVKVLTLNVWSGEETAAGRAKIAEIIAASGADIVGLQEMNSAAGAEVAAALGMNFHQQSAGGIQVLSRFPAVAQSAQGRGVELAISPTQRVWLFNAHLAAYPYQPYDLRDGTLPQEEAAVIAAADAARGATVVSYLAEMAAASAAGGPVFLTGDFNEPSHLDWTAAAAAATPRPFDLEVEFPASKRVVDAGFTDAFRQVRPDAVNDRGYTWTPGYPPPNRAADEVDDRIDFVYYRGAGVSPTGAWTLGLDAADPSTDIAVEGYNADHRGVVVNFTLPPCTPVPGDLNGDCRIDGDDWRLFRSNQHADLSGLSPAAAAARGDLNGDLRNDHADFVLFKASFEMANGEGALAAVFRAVPEPRGRVTAAVAMAGLVPLLCRASLGMRAAENASR